VELDAEITDGGEEQPMRTASAEPAAGRPLGRSLLLTGASAVLPGLAHWIAGRRRTAAVIAAVAVLLAAGAAILALTISRTEFLMLAVRPGRLTAVIAAALAVAVSWMVLVTDSYRVLDPRPATGVVQAGVILGLAALTLAVAAPPLAVAHYAYLQRNLVTTLFPDTPALPAAGDADSGRVDAAPVPADPTEAPLGGRSRITILLLASDAGPDRTGTRTDSVVAASIDTRTGDTTLLSLPRNLQRIPMPPGPLRAAWPGRSFPDLLNGVYAHVTWNADLLRGYRDRGAEGIKEVAAYILGIPIDYYAMVDLEGFSRFVDAMGGVTVTITQRLPIGGLLADGTRVPPVGYLEPGTRHLDGANAEWYVRSRRDGTDYDRMARQRCLIGALVRQASPLTVLRHFQQLTSATTELAETDIPRSVLPDLVALGEKIHDGASMRSLAFVPPLISTANPDYTKIRQLARAAIAEPAEPAPAPTTSHPKAGTARTPGTSGTRTTPTDVDAGCGLA
jgi:LCP family protein required for cell wall assembly